MDVFFFELSQKDVDEFLTHTIPGTKPGFMCYATVNIKWLSWRGIMDNFAVEKA